MILLSVRFTERRLSHADEHALGLSLRDELIGRYADASVSPIYAVHENGKPYIKNSSVTYSISHTDGCVVCAACVPYSAKAEELPLIEGSATDDGVYLIDREIYARELGVDVEYINADRPQERTESVAERYFSEQDNKLLSASADKTHTFFALWTKYESIVKCSGDGLVAIRSVASEKLPTEFQTTGFLLVHGDNLYALSLCTSKNALTR